MQRRESPRDQGESALSTILRRLFLSVPGLVSVVLVDDDGECVDYCSCLDPYETRVLGAHMELTCRHLGQSVATTGAGTWLQFGFTLDQHELLVHALGEGYALVLLLDREIQPASFEEAIEMTIASIRCEAGIDSLRG